MQESKKNLSRRTLLKYSAAGAALSMVGAGASAQPGGVGNPGTAACYDSSGAFDAGAAKKACFAMMKAFGYPISDVLQTDEFWVCDFLQRDFGKLGMGGIFWINAKGVYGKAGDGAYKGAFKDQHYGYLGHDIYLLPGQLLPEHRHVGGPEGYPPKMESWQVRHGVVDFFGEHKGAGDEKLISEMPESQRPWGYGSSWWKSRYVARRTAREGRLYTLQDPESWHCQRAGPQGAIVTEYATYHNHVEFSKPDMEFASSKAK